MIGAVGLAFLFHGLAKMSIAVVAPVSAVMGTATPVVFGVVIGERPSTLAWVGMGIAALAIVLIAHTIKGRGVSFMEGVLEYHGSTLTEDEVRLALAELEAADEEEVGS